MPFLKQPLPHLQATLAVIFIALGLLGFLPIAWLKPNQQLFGLLATAPLINVALIVAGITLAGPTMLNRQFVSFELYRSLKQALGLIFTVLAIGGFISLPIWPGQWLNTMTNTLASDIVYACTGLWWLYQGFFTNAATTSDPRQPLTSQQQQ